MRAACDTSLQVAGFESGAVVLWSLCDGLFSPPHQLRGPTGTSVTQLVFEGHTVVAAVDGESIGNSACNRVKLALTLCSNQCGGKRQVARSYAVRCHEPRQSAL